MEVEGAPGNHDLVSKLIAHHHGTARKGIGLELDGNGRGGDSWWTIFLFES